MIAVQQDSDRDAFFHWISDTLKPRALEQNIPARVFARSVEAIDFLPDVLDRQTSQTEFTRPIWEYLDIVASDSRIRQGRRMLRAHRDLLNRVENQFGVEPAVVCAIWGVETGFGTVRGAVPTLSALATLAFGGRRAGYFEAELIAAMRVIQSRNCKPADLVGSWAGALGHGQFMPSAMITYGVDFDGDGRENLCADDPTDALASIANYLTQHGWIKGQPWGLEVQLPPGFDMARTGRDQPLPSPEWAALGVTGANGGPVPDYGPGAILLPAGIKGAALLVLRNFEALTRYNRAEAYAIGVGHLSDRLLGARAFSAGWPTDTPPLPQSQVSEVQDRLTQAGFDTQGVDGLRGPNTARAVRAWQAANGLAPDGYLTEEMLERLRAQ